MKDFILTALKEQILAEFPDHDTETDEEDISSIQEEYIWREEHSYYPQKQDLDTIKTYLSSKDRTACLITGKGGSGKTSLMCAAVREYHGDQRLIARFCGVSPMSEDLYSLLTGILSECGLPYPVSENELYMTLLQRLKSIAEQDRTILLIDGLNQCRDGMR